MEFSSTCRVLQWFSVISPKSIVITQWSTQPLLIIHQPILHLNYRASRHFQSPGPNFIGFDVHWLKTWNLYVVTVKFLLTACNCRHFFFTSISIISDWSLFGCLKLLIFKNSSTPGLRSGNFFLNAVNRPHFLRWIQLIFNHFRFQMKTFSAAVWNRTRDCLL